MRTRNASVDWIRIYALDSRNCRREEPADVRTDAVFYIITKVLVTFFSVYFSPLRFRLAVLCNMYRVGTMVYVYNTTSEVRRKCCVFVLYDAFPLWVSVTRWGGRGSLKCFILGREISSTTISLVIIIIIIII